MSDLAGKEQFPTETHGNRWVSGDFGTNGFERDAPAYGQIFRFEDLPHTAYAESPDNSEAAGENVIRLEGAALRAADGRR
jgi:hypothetical protein